MMRSPVDGQALKETQLREWIARRTRKGRRTERCRRKTSGPGLTRLAGRTMMACQSAVELKGEEGSLKQYGDTEAVERR
jgi:hypothetical protein